MPSEAATTSPPWARVEAPGDGETEPPSGPPACGRRGAGTAVEAFEDPLAVVGVEPRPRVGDLDPGQLADSRPASMVTEPPAGV